MLILPAAPPVDYGLCRQTVTVYHNENGAVTRTVHRRALLDFKKTQSVDKTGSREANAFLLVIPGPEAQVAVGDKVLPGEGPECAAPEEWVALIPARVPGLAVVRYVDRKYWNGSVCHTEAGG